MRVHLRHKQQHIVVELQVAGGPSHVRVDDAEHEVESQYIDEHTLSLIVDGRRYCIDIARDGRERLVAVAGEVYSIVSESGVPSAHSVATVAAPEVTAPMPGKILQVFVQPGDHVVAGDALLILEAMKMENRLVAEAAGAVTEVRVAAGDMVDGGQVLVVLAYGDAPRS